MGPIEKWSPWLRHLIPSTQQLLRAHPPLEWFSEERRDDRQEIGAYGEALAARYLWSHGGCRILYRNFRAPTGGEVDLVCRHHHTLVFAEVKTRTSDLYGRPSVAVNAEKQKLIIRGAHTWLDWLAGETTPFYRYDIVEINLSPNTAPEIIWLQGAFTEPHASAALRS
jgi:putative endonuclease